MSNDTIKTEQAIREGYRWCRVYGCVCCWDGRKGRTFAEACGWTFDGDKGWPNQRPFTAENREALIMVHQGECPGSNHEWAREQRPHGEKRRWLRAALMRALMRRRCLDAKF